MDQKHRTTGGAGVMPSVFSLGNRGVRRVKNALQEPAPTFFQKIFEQAKTPVWRRPALLQSVCQNAELKPRSERKARKCHTIVERRILVDTLSPLLQSMETLKRSFRGLSIYERFEQAIVITLTLLIMAIVAAATWRLAISVVSLLLTAEIDPGNQKVFQTIFGMIFTVIIALEFKHSLLIVLTRQESVVRVRSIVLIAMLAMVRKFIIIDLGATDAMEIFALAAAILTLGVVYWLVREQDQRVGDNGPTP